MAALSDIFNLADGLMVERVPAGVSTYVYRIQRGAERCYLRALPEVGATFAPEVRAHELVLAAGARVPEVIHYEPHNELLGASLMLTTEIPGAPLHGGMPRELVREVVMAAGRDIAHINRIPVDGFGWVRRDMWEPPVCITAEYPSSRDALLTDAEVAAATLAAAGFSATEIGQVLVVLRAGEGWFAGEPAYLAHGDFDASHIYADADSYAGIIDFGEIRGAPRLYDLAHYRMHDGERLPYDTLPHLLEGYGSVAPLPGDARERICYLSLQIALRALARGIVRSPDSQLVRTARAAIRRDGMELKDLM